MWLASRVSPRHRTAPEAVLGQVDDPESLGGFERLFGRRSAIATGDARQLGCCAAAFLWPFGERGGGDGDGRRFRCGSDGDGCGGGRCGGIGGGVAAGLRVESDGLRWTAKSELPCLCALFNNTALLRTFNVNITQAIQMSKRCGVSIDQRACATATASGTSKPLHPPLPSPTLFYLVLNFTFSRGIRCVIRLI
ncbi:hypothetical protein B296_00038067 [Ensete ventricosum]|uniref:Bifunctional inhibitor/plant lipid transfer protein/seed storage helical domain-containing protein n=1 Tax=Ensete ventricosum TaxID=4639 RepID=A0A426YCL3_ENSVE|nr:hypothetical protein B296_00038067 [Ensete ventricosum]